MNAAVRSVARAELRRHLGSFLLIGLVAGLTASVALGSAALARRTATAYPRLEAATSVDDVRAMVIARTDEETIDLAGRLAVTPGVVRSRFAPSLIGRVIDDEVNFASVLAGPEHPDDLLQPVVLAGRAPAPDAADEVLAAEWFVRETGLGLGTSFAVRTLLREEVFQFGSEDGPPPEGRGPEVQLTVVGVARSPGISDDLPPFTAGPGVAAAHPDAFRPVVTVLFLDLADDPAALGALRDEVAAINDQLELPAGGQFLPVTLDETSAFRATTATTTGVVVAGLIALALGAVLAGLVVLAQSSVRHHAVVAAEHDLHGAIGLTRAQLTAARGLAALVPAAVAGGCTVVAGLATATLEPVGPARFYEPTPGWSPNQAFVAVAGLAVVVLTVGALAGAARWSTRARGGSRLQASRLVDLAAQLGGRPPAVVGLRFGLERSAAAGSVPVRSTAAALAVAVAGLAGVAVFTSSLSRLVASPERHGWPAELVVSNPRPADLAALGADDRTATVTEVVHSDIQLGQRTVPAIAQRAEKGQVTWEIISGRPPTGDGDIVLGRRVADDLSVGVGDRISARGSTGDLTLTVVGIGVLPVEGGSIGRTVGVTSETLDRIGLSEPYLNAGVILAEGVDAEEVAWELSRDLELTVANLPDEMRSLSELRPMVAALGGFLALLGAAALGHTLLAASRRRRSDLAVLRTMGFTRRDGAVVLVVMAVVLATIGILVGLPLGVAVGSTVWRLVADGAAVAPDPRVQVLHLVAVAAGAVGVALVLAVVPARRSTRLSPADELRTE